MSREQQAPSAISLDEVNRVLNLGRILFDVLSPQEKEQLVALVDIHQGVPDSSQMEQITRLLPN